MKLSEAAVNSIFYDDNTKLNGNPIKWIVMGHNIDGQGITTLASYDGITGMALDVKEPQNPDTDLQNYGNSNYEYSNMLQWLNSDKAANEWYENQHEYDQAPNSDTVGDTYANRAGFLNGFTDVFKSAMSYMTKMGITRKVHFPGAKELLGNSTLAFNIEPDYTDLGATYPNFYSPYRSNIEVTSSSPQPGILVRNTLSSKSNGFIVMNYARATNYTGYRTIYCDYSPYSKRNNKSYVVPIIYVNSDLPVTYSDNAYHTSYSVSTPYADYGNHKGGFSFGIRADSGSNDDVYVYIKRKNDSYIYPVIKTVTISPNTDATITLSDSDVSDFPEGQLTIELLAVQNDINAYTTFTYTKTAESTPVILAEDIGVVAYEYHSDESHYQLLSPLTVSFQTYDEDGDDIDIVIEASKINSGKFTVYTQNNVPHNTTISYTLTDAQVQSAIVGNSDTKIIITATDSNGNYAVTTIPYVTSEIPYIFLESDIRWRIDTLNSYQKIYDAMRDDPEEGKICDLVYDMYWKPFNEIDKTRTEVFIDDSEPLHIYEIVDEPTLYEIYVRAFESDLPFFETLSGGQHTLTVNAYNTLGYKGTISHEFTYIGTPKISVDSDLGTHSSEFTFNFSVTGINGDAMITATIDNKSFYQLNYATDGTYVVRISNTLLNSIGGGTHNIAFSLVDKTESTATASTAFVKTANRPVVFMATNLGDRISAFAVPYVIKNANSEHPSLTAYIDTKDSSHIIATIADASTANSFTLSAATFAELSEGSHTIITEVTNTAGSTIVNTSFNAIKSSDLHSGLKLGYEDDTWDGTTYPNRIFEQNTVTHDNVEYQTFIDRTPYDTQGEAVTGGMLSTISRGIQNALSGNVIVNSDGSLTETSANGTTTLTKTENGYVEVYTDKDNNTVTKQVFFNADGTIAESTSYVKGE